MSGVTPYLAHALRWSPKRSSARPFTPSSRPMARQSAVRHSSLSRLAQPVASASSPRLKAISDPRVGIHVLPFFYQRTPCHVPLQPALLDRGDECPMAAQIVAADRA